MSSFYGRPSARAKSTSQTQNRGAVRRRRDMGTPALSRKTRRRARLEDVYNDEQYEPGMLLQQRPPVTFSDDDSLSSENELGGFYGGDGDHYSDEHAQATLAITPSPNGHGTDTGQKRPDLRTLLQEQQMLLRTIITKQEALEAKQTTFEQKLSVLEEKVVTQNTATPSSSDSSPHGSKKRKRLVSRELSVSGGSVLITCLQNSIRVNTYPYRG